MTFGRLRYGLGRRYLLYSLPVATLPIAYHTLPKRQSSQRIYKPDTATPIKRSPLKIYILEPILTLRRLIWLCVLFVPVFASLPLLWINSTLWYRILTKQMSKAGPTFIKLGQWAASRTDLFSPDLCHILGRLHSAAHPHSIRHTRRVLTSTYSDAESLDDIFEEFDDKPIGCGAIAQVYKGKLREEFIPDDWRVAHRHEDDSWIVTFITNVLNNYQNQQDTTQELITSSRHVAVKVIHPHVTELIERDLAILHCGASVLSLFPGIKWLSLPEEVAVFGELMQSQLNLSVEASNLGRFEDNFRERRGAASFPKPVFALSAKDVLVEEFEDALPLKTFLKFGGGGFEERIAGLGLDAFLNMLLIDNFAHADLHPGNIYIKFYKPTSIDLLKNVLSSLISRPRSTTDLTMNEASQEVMNALLPLAKQINKHGDDEEAVQQWTMKLRQLNEDGFQPEIVFLDTGLITELDDKNRNNFLELFQAVSHFDGYRVGQLMIERSRCPELAKDKETFALKMQHIVLGVKSKTFSLAKIRLSEVLSQVLSSVRDHHVKMEADFVNTVLSILLLEGIGRQLDPNMDLFKAAIPILRQLGKKVGTSGSYAQVDKGNLGAMLKNGVYEAGLYTPQDRAWNLNNDISPNGVPVLFIPGNAGSYKQGRSIAAELAKQYYSSYGIPNSYLESQAGAPPDFWTVDTNEELSAFHAGTIRRQAEYILAAIDYILNQYTHQNQPPESIIVVAHSMGGIVVNELFNLPEYRTGLVDLVISLSTPHAMPPTPFSRNMASLYDQRYNASVNIAVSGGSADSLLPADVTYAPIGHNSLSILSTSIPGVWAPISHQAIVWCDQLRRKLARAVLLSIDSNKSTKLKPKESVLNIWQKSLTGIVYENTLNDTFDVDINASMSSGTFTAVNITRNSAAWSLGKPPPKWVTGDVAPTIRLLTDISPEPAYKEFEEGEPPITILGCKNVRPLHSCRHLSIKDSAVMPYLPRDEKWLPVRHGADEEQSLYMLDADSDTLRDDESVVVLKTNNNRKGSWMTSQFAPTNEETRVDASFARLLFSSVPLISQTSGMLALRRNYRVVNAPATSLLVYKIEAEQSPCVSTQFNKKELFQPLLKHVVESTKGLELTYHPSLNGKIMLESHLSHSPYLTSGRASNDAGLSLEIFADTFNTESCFPFQKLTIGVDILASIAKWGTRYRSALIGFALGIWCVAFRRQLKALDSSGTSENFIKSLTMVFRREMIVFSFVLVISILVSSSYSSLTLYFIGLHDIRLWFIAPLLLLASYGLLEYAFHNLQAREK
ncbi:hypothetical protein E3Q24_02371 [Wallemia mellicola]|nr:hypothetical protein E3Q24_02371 [Wallemia mellicola]